jgi:predicted metal-dependent phosphoesterase TrpH
MMAIAIDKKVISENHQVNSIRLDLHIHTTASDGTWDIGTLLDKLTEKGIGIFSVTDHDELASTRALWDRRDTLPVRYVPGVEVSVSRGVQEYHLTCYGFDPYGEDIEAVTAANRRARDAHNRELVAFAAEHYEGISVDDYEAYTHERKRGGWKALWYLLDRRILGDTWEFFRLMARWGVPMVFPAPEETIPRLKAAGARVMLAHPSVYTRSRMKESELDIWRSLGIDGLECYSSQVTEEDSRFYIEYCDRHGLMITGGSDCHGDFVSRPLGEPKVTLDDIRVDFL